MYKEKEYRCLECGWSVRTDEHDLKCPICKSDLQVGVDYGEQDNNIAKAIEEDELEEMMWRIKTDGSEYVWEFIETIRNPFARASERFIFIKAGGKIPERGIKI